MAVIVQAQREAVSVLLQVLYFLHQGHIQFLAGDYRTRVLDTHGPDAFPKKGPRQGMVLTVHSQDIRSPTRNTERADVDLSKEKDDAETTDLEDSGSSPRYTSGCEEDKANIPVPSSQQMEATRSQTGTSMPPRNTEAAGFGSDTSPRTESGDNDELSRAEPN